MVHSVGEGDCEMVQAQPGQVQGTALLLCHWSTPTAEDLHPAKAIRQLRTLQTILWDRFGCLQEAQITKLSCRALTLYYSRRFGFGGFCVLTHPIFFNSL